MPSLLVNLLRPLAPMWMAVLLAAPFCLPPRLRAEDARPAAPAAIGPKQAKADPDGKWLWYDLRTLGVEGKGWTDTPGFYHRLPARAQGVVGKYVWGLSRHSAGLRTRFVTDADRIAARWTVASKEMAMDPMPATGVSGLDLYVRHRGRWQWIGVGRPRRPLTNQATLAKGIPEGSHQYLLYLPLYNELRSLEIGIPPGAALVKAPPYPRERAKPIVFYGTSITQGGCASRPGMAHTAILSRRLDWPFINLGFMGTGTMDLEVGALMAELDASVYVVDCLPNMKAPLVAQRAEPFVTALRKARPDVPIVLVENIAYQAGAFLPPMREKHESRNRALRTAYERLAERGITKLHYIPGRTLLGNDGEATVDGTHPTDLGFHRFAAALEPVLRRVLESREGEANEDP